MAPRKAATGEDPVFKFMMSVLTSCEAIKPDWEVVARDNGYGYARNAQSRFKDILKKQGFKFENGKIVNVDDKAATSAKASEPPKTPKQGRKTDKGKASCGSGRKRPAEEMADDNSELKEDGVSDKDEPDTVKDEI